MSNKKDNLGDRIKKNYEDVYRQKLPGRMPIMLRVDGKSFHSYTKGCQKPVDNNLVECMNLTAMELCKQIQGAKLAYIQSDEISIFINNYESMDAEPWFDNNIQKMVSIAGSIASTTFTLHSPKIWNGQTKTALFDARVFVLPKEEVCNAFLFRQQDATRNSVQMLARSLYSHKQLNNKNNSQLQEMIFQKGINWNDRPTSEKRGRCVIKVDGLKESINPKTGEKVITNRPYWKVDNEIPIFSQDRNYIDRFIFPKDKS